MGEAGPEAVMPLRRLPGGRLGVEAVGGSGQGGNVITFAPTTTITVQGGASEETVGQIRAELDRRDQRIRTELPDLLMKAKRDRKLVGF
jgi:phage-related minor tail protein